MPCISMFEAATILMELSNFQYPSRKRQNSDPETDLIFIPKRPRSPRVKKIKSSSSLPPLPPTKIVRKLARKRKAREMNLTATPAMPAAMRERILEMGGYEMELVIQKQLHDTDLNKNQGRLALSIQKLRFDFATEEEGKLLNRQVEKKNKMGMDVMIIDPCLRESVICLKKWKIGSGDVYCLMTHWNSFVQQNCLKSGEVLQLWSFRKDGVDAANQTENPHHLCFAMAKPHISEFF